MYIIDIVFITLSKTLDNVVEVRLSENSLEPF